MAEEVQAPAPENNPYANITPKMVLTDPKFHGLDIETKRYVLGKVDPGFGTLGKADQDQALSAGLDYWNKYYAPPPPPTFGEKVEKGTKALLSTLAGLTGEPPVQTEFAPPPTPRGQTPAVRPLEPPPTVGGKNMVPAVDPQTGKITGFRPQTWEESVQKAESQIPRTTENISFRIADLDQSGKALDQQANELEATRNAIEQSRGGVRTKEQADELNAKIKNYNTALEHFKLGVSAYSGKRGQVERLVNMAGMDRYKAEVEAALQRNLPMPPSWESQHPIGAATLAVLEPVYKARKAYDEAVDKVVQTILPSYDPSTDVYGTDIVKDENWWTTYFKALPIEVAHNTAKLVTDPVNIAFIAAGMPPPAGSTAVRYGARNALRIVLDAAFAVSSATGAYEDIQRGDYASASVNTMFAILGLTHAPLRIRNYVLERLRAQEEVRFRYAKNVGAKAREAANEATGATPTYGAEYTGPRMIEGVAPEEAPQPVPGRPAAIEAPPVQGALPPGPPAPRGLPEAPGQKRVYLPEGGEIVSRGEPGLTAEGLIPPPGAEPLNLGERGGLPPFQRIERTLVGPEEGVMPPGEISSAEVPVSDRPVSQEDLDRMAARYRMFRDGYLQRPGLNIEKWKDEFQRALDRHDFALLRRLRARIGVEMPGDRELGQRKAALEPPPEEALKQRFMQIAGELPPEQVVPERGGFVLKASVVPGQGLQGPTPDVLGQIEAQRRFFQSLGVSEDAPELPFATELGIPTRVVAPGFGTYREEGTTLPTTEVNYTTHLTDPTASRGDADLISALLVKGSGQSAVGVVVSRNPNPAGGAENHVGMEFGKPDGSKFTPEDITAVGSAAPVGFETDDTGTKLRFTMWDPSSPETFFNDTMKAIQAIGLSPKEGRAFKGGSYLVTAEDADSIIARERDTRRASGRPDIPDSILGKINTAFETAYPQQGAILKWRSRIAARQAAAEVDRSNIEGPARTQQVSLPFGGDDISFPSPYAVSRPEDSISGVVGVEGRYRLAGRVPIGETRVTQNLPPAAQRGPRQPGALEDAFRSVLMQQPTGPYKPGQTRGGIIVGRHYATAPAAPITLEDGTTIEVRALDRYGLMGKAFGNQIIHDKGYKAYMQVDASLFHRILNMFMERYPNGDWARTHYAGPETDPRYNSGQVAFAVNMDGTQLFGEGGPCPVGFNGCEMLNHINALTSGNHIPEEDHLPLMAATMVQASAHEIIHQAYRADDATMESLVTRFMWDNRDFFKGAYEWTLGKLREDNGAVIKNLQPIFSRYAARVTKVYREKKKVDVGGYIWKILGNVDDAPREDALRAEQIEALNIATVDEAFLKVKPQPLPSATIDSVLENAGGKDFDTIKAELQKPASQAGIKVTDAQVEQLLKEKLQQLPVRRRDFKLQWIKPPKGEVVNPVVDKIISKDKREALLVRWAKRDPNAGAPKTPRVVFETGDPKLPRIPLGDITLDDWVETRWGILSPKERKDAAMWYNYLLNAFTRVFGKKDAPRYLMAWGASQANTSASGGLMNLLRAMDAAVGFKTRLAGISDTQIKAILAGKGVDAGFALKLMDFSDCIIEGPGGRKKIYRTAMNNDPRGLRPFVTDTHTAQSMGFVSEKMTGYVPMRFWVGDDQYIDGKKASKAASQIGAAVEIKAGEEYVVGDRVFTSRKEANAHAVKTNQNVEPRAMWTPGWLERIYGERGKKFAQENLTIDMPGSVSEAQYQWCTEKGNRFAAELNRRKFGGRSDWTPMEIQAIDWTGFQKLRGRAPEFAHDIFDKNTYSFPMVAQFAENSPLAQAHPELRRMSSATQQRILGKAITKVMPKIAKACNVFAVEETPGQQLEMPPGGITLFEKGTETPASIFNVLGSPESTTAFANAMALAFNMPEVSVMRIMKSGSRTVFTLTDPTGNHLATPEARKEFQMRLVNKLGDSARRYLPYKSREGTGIQIIRQRTSWNDEDKAVFVKAVNAVAKDMAIPSKELLKDFDNVDISEYKDNWQADPQGNRGIAFRGILGALGRERITGQVDNLFGGLVRESIADAIESDPDAQAELAQNQVVESPSRGKKQNPYQGLGQPTTAQDITRGWIAPDGKFYELDNFEGHHGTYAEMDIDERTGEIHGLGTYPVRVGILEAYLERDLRGKVYPRNAIVYAEMMGPVSDSQKRAVVEFAKAHPEGRFQWSCGNTGEKRLYGDGLHGIWQAEHEAYHKGEEGPVVLRAGDQIRESKLGGSMKDKQEPGMELVLAWDELSNDAKRNGATYISMRDKDGNEINNLVPQKWEHHSDEDNQRMVQDLAKTTTMAYMDHDGVDLAKIRWDWREESDRIMKSFRGTDYEPSLMGEDEFYRGGWERMRLTSSDSLLRVPIWVLLDDGIVSTERGPGVRTREKMNRPPKYIEGLKAKIAEEGLTEAIAIDVDPDGTVHIIDGTHRLMIAHELGFTSVPVEMVPHAIDKGGAYQFVRMYALPTDVPVRKGTISSMKANELEDAEVRESGMGNVIDDQAWKFKPPEDKPETLDEYRADLQARMRLRMREARDKAAVFTGWRFNIGDRVRSPKTGRIYEITNKWWSSNRKQFQYYYKSLDAMNESGAWSQEIADKTMVPMRGPLGLVAPPEPEIVESGMAGYRWANQESGWRTKDQGEFYTDVIRRTGGDYVVEFREKKSFDRSFDRIGSFTTLRAAQAFADDYADYMNGKRERPQTFDDKYLELETPIQGETPLVGGKPVVALDDVIINRVGNLEDKKYDVIYNGDRIGGVAYGWRRAGGWGWIADRPGKQTGQTMKTRDQAVREVLSWYNRQAKEKGASGYTLSEPIRESTLSGIQVVGEGKGASGARGTSFASRVSDSYRILDADGKYIGGIIKMKNRRFPKGPLFWRVSMPGTKESRFFNTLSEAKAYAKGEDVTGITENMNKASKLEAPPGYREIETEQGLPDTLDPKVLGRPITDWNSWIGGGWIMPDGTPLEFTFYHSKSLAEATGIPEKELQNRDVLNKVAARYGLIRLRVSGLPYGNQRPGVEAFVLPTDEQWREIGKMQKEMGVPIVFDLTDSSTSTVMATGEGINDMRRSAERVMGEPTIVESAMAGNRSDIIDYSKLGYKYSTEKLFGREMSTEGFIAPDGSIYVIGMGAIHAERLAKALKIKVKGSLFYGAGWRNAMRMTGLVRWRMQPALYTKRGLGDGTLLVESHVPPTLEQMDIIGRMYGHTNHGFFTGELGLPYKPGAGYVQASTQRWTDYIRSVDKYRSEMEAAEEGPQEPSDEQPLISRAELEPPPEGIVENAARGPRTPLGGPPATQTQRPRPRPLAGLPPPPGHEIIQGVLGGGPRSLTQAFRSLFTGERDAAITKGNQTRDQVAAIVPKPEDQTALFFYREFRNLPQQDIQNLINGTHDWYREYSDYLLNEKNVPPMEAARLTNEARDRVRKLEPYLRRALNPTPEMLQADQIITDFMQEKLNEGIQNGFLRSNITPSEYSTHILIDDYPPDRGEGLVTNETGGTMPKNFTFAKKRTFGNIVKAVIFDKNPATLNMVDAMTVYNQSHAKVLATRQFIEALQRNDVLRWGTRRSEHIPKDWIPFTKNRNKLWEFPVSITDARTGKPVQADFVAYGPRKIVEALYPITDPNFFYDIAGMRKLRIYQAYIKSVELGLSMFHMKALMLAAMANMNPVQAVKSLKLNMMSPEFRAAEIDAARYGCTTDVMGRYVETRRQMATPIDEKDWLDTVEGLPLIKQGVDIAHLITHYMFGVMHRKFKVMDFQLQKAAFLAKNPNATPTEQRVALTRIASEINGVYGGLHWENMGWNKTTVNAVRAILLAPDWTFSNILSTGAAFEKGTAGNTARKFWALSFAIGMGLTALMTFMNTGHLPKDPTRVEFGKDEDGKEASANLFFSNAPNDLVNLIHNVQSLGLVGGLAQSLGGKMAPVLRYVVQTITNRDWRGKEIAPKGSGVIVGTARSAWHAVKTMGPVPFSISTAADMIWGKESNSLVEYLSSILLAARIRKTAPEGTKERISGYRKGEIVPSGEQPEPGLWQQITSGKMTLPTVQGFARMPLDAALNAYEAADEDTRKLYLPLLQKKLPTLFKYRSQKVREDLTKRLQSLGILAPSRGLPPPP